jgi:hypothetical protein
VRDPTHTSLRRLAHGQMRLTVAPAKLIGPFAAHGMLTLTISRASCLSVTRGTYRLHPVLRRRARLDSHGRAVFSFRSPVGDGYYGAQLSFGGSALLLRGQDAFMYLGVFAPANPSQRPAIQFVSPDSWAPCG